VLCRVNPLISDMNTGCTPIVLAIRSGHVEVVRELLAAGAIVPPPGLTSDPVMLSLLYPQPMYGIPPPSFNNMPGPPEFFPQNGFYPGPGPQAHPGQHGHFTRKDSTNGNGPTSTANGTPANLPPAEVSKTIPCRNFPNCKYGAGCVFFHPPRPAGPGFFPGNNGFVPGFEGGFPPNFQQGPYFVPNGFNSFPPHPPAPQQQEAPAPTPEQSSGDASASDIPSAKTQAIETPVSPAPIQNGGAVGSAIAPVFVPQFAPAPPHMASPPTSQFGLSPMSPSMLAGSLPSIPPAEAFFAQSPPNIPPFQQPNGFANPRRQSFGQPFMGGPKPFHTKKPSFSNNAGPRPFRPTQNLGAWKDGNPPPCAFFIQGKCRNGEYCKFPHMDESGNDVRHPDVVRGVIPPLPSLGKQPRGMRMSGGGFGGFDPNFRAQHGFVQQNGFAPQAQASAAASQQPQAIPEGDVASAETAVPQTNGPTETKTESAETTSEEKSAASALPASVPAKPVTNNNNSGAPVPIGRSASQPGIQRVHANGFSSRSHSPAPSNVSFHGNGHPRRAGSRVPFVGGGRSSSTTGENTRQAQRVPGADEFPTLGGGSANTSPKPDTGDKWGGKTAAQVLSAPAPHRPKASEPEAAAAEVPESEQVARNGDSQSVKSDEVSCEI